MAPADWISLIFILTFSLPVKGSSLTGYEACFGNSSIYWEYDSHSYSCIAHFRELRNWTEARDYCRQIQLGNKFGVTTHLAKIDHSVTNSVVAYLSAQSDDDTWIGLHYMEDKGGFRWDGYPHETPKYVDSNWEYRNRTYVSMNWKRWMGQHGDTELAFACQHQGKTIGTVTCEQEVLTDGFRIKCTSEESPVKAKCQWTYKHDVDTNFVPWRQINDSVNYEFEIHNTTGDETSYTTTCTTVLTSNNTNMTVGTLLFKMKMYPDINEWGISTNQKAQTIGSLNIDIDPPVVPQLRARGGKIIILEASSHVVCVEDGLIDLVCKWNSGNPPVYSVTMSCEFSVSDSDEGVEHTVEGTDVVINKLVSRDMHGKNCTCIGNHLTGPVQASPLTFLVVSRPSDVSCTINVLAYGLMVSCEIGKVYPEASCQWFYHYADDQHSTSVSNSQINEYIHQEYTDVDGSVYYKSICSVTLTPDKTSLRKGLFTVKVKVAPDFRGMYLSMTNDTFTDTREIDIFCKYINCFFVATIDFPLTASVIQQLLEQFWNQH